MPLDLIHQQEGQVHILDLCGVLDATTSDAFYEELHKLLENTPPHIILDFTGVEFINSRALGVLVDGHRQALQREGKIVFVGVSYTISRPMEKAQIGDKFIMRDTRKEGLSLFD